MAAPMSKLGIMNLMGQAANKKSQMGGQNQMPNDEEDPINSGTPNANTAPQSTKSKKVAAMKEQGKGKGQMAAPGSKPGMNA
jgi:hypothetical protein